MKFHEVLSFLAISLLLGCASQTTPTGGPKDEIPPELVSSNPTNGQKNFEGGTLELTFNELIKLKDPKEEILITPSPGKNTKFTAKKNKVFIEPETPWLENTTYSLSFREGVQDLTEGNPADNLRLAFSTGETIDSLSIQGNVGQLFSEKIPDKITVALYQSDTFNIFNHAPTYFTKANKKGKFSIQNLKAGQYFIYAFEDKNKNLKVESKSEKFSFKSEPINLEQDSDSISLNLFNVDARPPAITSIRHTDQTTLVRFNKLADSLSVSLQNKSQALVTYGDNQGELIFYHGFESTDSIKVKLHFRDSVQQSLDTTFYLKSSITKMAKESFSLKEINESYDASKKEFNYKISFNKPISIIRFDSLYIQKDSVDRQLILAEDLYIDTLHHTINLKVKVEAKPDTSKIKDTKQSFKPYLRYGKGAFISIETDTSKSITKNITFVKEEDTGLVTGKVETKEKNYEIELVTADNTLIYQVRNTKELNFKFLKPQDYKIRVIIDTNGNGKWDAGNFEKGIEPEKIFYYKSDEGKYVFPIRANWEYGPLVIKF